MPARPFVALPDPGEATDIDGIADRLRRLKRWAGDPSFQSITGRVNEAWAAQGRPAAESAAKNTVADCFRPGRRRLNTDLVLAVVRTLHPDAGYVDQWRQALRVVGGEISAAAQVRVQDSLPPDLAEFTGRDAELGRLLGKRRGDTVMISAIGGMAGIGKTRLAVHAGHLLVRERHVDRVLFVNLRGFHPDPAQPPADPAAVLDGFLRLLGVPGHQVPHDLPARAAAYRDRLTGTRTLVVLDDAADLGQVRPLLPHGPGCLTLVTSRRRLRLPSATRMTMEVFTAAEAQAYLARAAPDVPVGADPRARARIARRCGHLPLALGLVAGHIRATPGWTLTDHADRLDERHADRRLDTAVELALDLSYRRLTAGQRRLLRRLALHPWHDLDAYAAAALAGAGLATTRADLRQLTDAYLLLQPAPGRYGLHDLVRAYAAGRAGDEDPRSDRRAALTRLFDLYQAACAAAMDALHPAENHLRPTVAPADTPMPVLTDPVAARAWLDTERPALVAVAVHAADHGWPAHTVRLSATLFRYLAGGHLADAVTVHDHAGRAARQLGDPTGRAHALTNLGVAYLQLGRYDTAATALAEALSLFRRATDPSGEARTLNNLGIAAKRLGEYRAAIGHCEQALTLFRRAGEHTNEARTLSNLGALHERLGDYPAATDHLRRALRIFRRTGDQTGAAHTLHDLGVVAVRVRRYADAATHLTQALEVFQRLGHRDGQGWAIDGLGLLSVHYGDVDAGRAHYEQALAIHRETGDREGEAAALNGLGEAARAAGHAGDAHRHHTDAHRIAEAIGDRFQQARAHAGLGHACLARGDLAEAQEQFRSARRIYSALGTPEADRLPAHVGENRPVRKVDYDERQHLVYARARALSAETLADWMRVFARHAPAARPLTVLDLGCGTGRFTPALAGEFGGPVVGVEPSARMRAVAEESARHPAVRYLAGAAEAVPLPDASCDLVLIYLVLHHVADHAAAAAEVARVLRPGGRVLIRGAFADRMPDLPWYRYFPGARVVDEQVFPRLDQVVGTFAAAGLRVVTLERTRQRIAPTLTEWADRLRLRGSSTFEHLSEAEIAAGFAALDADVAREGVPQPVDEDADLLVLAPS